MSRTTRTSDRYPLHYWYQYTYERNGELYVEEDCFDLAPGGWKLAKKRLTEGNDPMLILQFQLLCKQRGDCLSKMHHMVGIPKSFRKRPQKAFRVHTRNVLANYSYGMEDPIMDVKPASAMTYYW